VKAEVQGVGDCVLLNLEGYQFLMARSDAHQLGFALIRVVLTGGDVLDETPSDAP
jgi:hypothetical protein